MAASDKLAATHKTAAPLLLAPSPSPASTLPLFGPSVHPQVSGPTDPDARAAQRAVIHVNLAPVKRLTLWSTVDSLVAMIRHPTALTSLSYRLKGAEPVMSCERQSLAIAVLWPSCAVLACDGSLEQQHRDGLLLNCYRDETLPCPFLQSLMV